MNEVKQAEDALAALIERLHAAELEVERQREELTAIEEAEAALCGRKAAP